MEKISLKRLVFSIAVSLFLAACGGTDDIAVPADDSKAPAVVATGPENEAVGVAVNTQLAASFDEGLNEATISNDSFTLLDPAENLVPGTVTYDADTWTAIYSPDNDLHYETTYTATVTTAVVSLMGHSLPAAYTWTFTTGVAPDFTPPVINTFSPQADAADVGTDITLTVTFSEPMAEASINSASFYLTAEGGDTTVPATVSYDPDTLTAILVPESGLQFYTSHTAILTDQITDAAGNALEEMFTWSFKTEQDPLQPLWYDVYGRYCGTGMPTVGCNYYSDGLKIIDVEDPYFYSQYYLQYNLWEHYDDYGYRSYYLGWGWLSPTSILYNEYGKALN